MKRYGFLLAGLLMSLFMTSCHYQKVGETIKQKKSLKPFKYIKVYDNVIANFEYSDTYNLTFETTQLQMKDFWMKQDKDTLKIGCRYQDFYKNKRTFGKAAASYYATIKAPSLEGVFVQDYASFDCLNDTLKESRFIFNGEMVSSAKLMLDCDTFIVNRYNSEEESELKGKVNYLILPKLTKDYEADNLDLKQLKSKKTIK